MGREERLDQITGVLARNQIKFQTNDDGEFMVLYGSAGVFIDVIDQGESNTIVALHAPISLDMDLRGKRLANAIVAANDLNRGSRFLRFVVYVNEETGSGNFVVEADLRGENMQGEELMATLAQMANAADDLDDQVVDDHGGKTLQALWADEDDGVEV
ncbi:MAG: hypothetical protein DYH12_03005 [Sorangiineae bacterium PRO1]|nr:hypothetical protein [Sorangiineae bacterium PRO1]